jgi:hypothetical protein
MIVTNLPIDVKERLRAASVALFAARAEVLAHHTSDARRPLWEALVAEARGAGA